MLTPRDRVAVGFASSGHFMCHGAKMALPAVTLSLPAREFGVDLPAMGLAVMVFTIMMGLASLPAGLLADRIGSARVVTLFFWATALGAALCWWAPGYGGFVAAHAVLGAAAGLYHPSGLGLLSLSVERRNLTLAMGLHGLAGPLGMAAAPLLMFELAETNGWRAGFGALSLAAVAFALVGHVLRRTGALDDEVPRHVAEDRRVLRPHVVLLVAVVAVNAFLLDGFTVLFPESVAAHGVWVWDLDVVLFAVLAAGGVGQLCAAFLGVGERREQRYAYVVAAQPVLLLATAFALDAPMWPFFLMASFAFVNFMTQPIENALLASYTARARRGTVYALKFVVGLLLGAPASYLAAWSMETSGFAATWLLLGLTGLVAIAAVLFFVTSARRAVQPSA